jgi:hypothetical protein
MLNQIFLNTIEGDYLTAVLLCFILILLLLLSGPPDHEQDGIRLGLEALRQRSKQSEEAAQLGPVQGLVLHGCVQACGLLIEELHANAGAVRGKKQRLQATRALVSLLLDGGATKWRSCTARPGADICPV